MQLVGDDDDGLAVRLHVADDGEELLGLLGGEHRGGLVQDQHVCAAIEHLHDLQRLLLGDRHVVHLLVGIDVEAVAVADGLHLLGDGLAVDAALLRQAQDHVFRSGEHVHQLEVLVNHADSQVEGVLGRTDGDLAAIHENLSGIGVVDA